MPLQVLEGFADLRLCLLCLAILVGGCRQEPPQFEANRVSAMALERSRDIPTEAALADVTTVIAELFGTPDQPLWPHALLEEEDAQHLVSLERLQLAAGAVTSDQSDRHTGLYQEHCVICHGVSGSGAGPASRYQIPYPRDFRAGVFKWKSTPRSDKPTRDDLQRLLRHGVPGAPMPAFPLLSNDQRDALVDYVIYLSVRGETERELLAMAVDELEYEEQPPDEDLRYPLEDVTLVSAEQDTDGAAVVNEIVNEIVDEWLGAEPSEVPPVPESVSWQRGKEIFHGQIANCAGCHGPDGQGGLPQLDFDDWTKDFTTRIGITPDDAEAVKPFRKAGALPPRKIDPRVLAGGVIRGGSDPETIYRRIEHGIAGTPMPSVEISEEAGGKTGLTPSEAWDLVAYVQHLTGYPMVQVDSKDEAQ